MGYLVLMLSTLIGVNAVWCAYSAGEAHFDDEPKFFVLAVILLFISYAILVPVLFP